ncbi:MAG: 30S ribosomal protein S2 [Candidatus Yanofskybacteria bacterium RIFCSPHIGHO2_02_FULL_43_22]|uniref:Small ribosomal subunit protein uS2 n=1 Tax=Candidatus Yanofskybacteria bacterium RIFCSPHIGHO2_02_FULL_43_22 TaxID=1802681 RepID=A0A1F8FS74_9BACT|nr:MAG: 30S ribosomal protein S2 [Candidatus Yanofskybacteria bacterium RIFCSPHIGHO2_02_FULL_43_22]
MMTEPNNIQIPYEDMLKAGMHFGRKRTVFNPAMERYVFTVRDGICIIDLLKTQAQLNNSIEFLKKTINPPAGGRGLVLFVSLTKQSSDKVKELAESLNMPYVLDRWLGGTLTNLRVISDRIKKLEEMEQAQKSGELDKYTKKERTVFAKELAKMQTKFGGLRTLTRMPSAIFVSSLKESELPVHEAKKTGVKIVGIANTDSNPDELDHIIPANDRSKKSVDLIIEAIKKELV